jgi:threonine dehydratase
MVSGGPVRMVHLPDEGALRGAAEVVAHHLTPTPVVACPPLGPDVLLKLETLQPTGSFKVRGALAAVAAALARTPEVELVAASAGNHGLGVAYAADRLGARATVVVAENASSAKVRALEQFGITLVRYGDGYDEAEAHALSLARGSGGHFVSPYNDADVIAGQATLAAELATQVPGATTVVLPVGGGGLLSGVSLVAPPAVRIVGVEPEVFATMTAALKAGRPVPIESGPTIADGLAGSIEEGSVTFEIARRRGVGVVTASEHELEAAVHFLATEVGLVAEGAGAAATAAWRTGRIHAGDGPVVLVVTGRNIDASLLASILSG